ncbi:hypothetical protein EV2_044848 [Malus domestica]
MYIEKKKKKKKHKQEGAFTKLTHVKPHHSAELQEEEALKVDCLKPHHSAELQEEEEPEVDHLELHYAIQPQKTKANAVGTNPQTSDDQVKFDHQIPTSGQSSSSCL